MECEGPPAPLETTAGAGDYEGATTVEQDTTLSGDVRCAKGPAFVVTADNVVLDLGGHTVSGQADAGVGGPGIVLRGVSGVTVRNGSVRRFEAGVVIEGGSANVVEDLVVEDNIGSPDGEFGDGIVVNGSVGNTIRDNVVRRNGPFSGISLGRGAADNELVGNTVADNNMLHVGDPAAGSQAMGIRVEGPAANRNRIVGNTVTGSGGDGIVVLSTCDDFDTEPPCAGTPPNEQNEIAENTVSGNGTSGRGSGIRIFAMPVPVPPVANTVRDNVADDNAFYGIAIDALPLGSTGNTAMRNRAHGNREFDGSDGRLMPPCGPNTWEDNDFGAVNQPCVSGKKEPPSPAE
ncbi:MAG: right-handed parallel beta-helix repeat-containing protein [Actinomycetota bacterium]|nr:right-handed parallel beta-helix repeat-containing protein [Actinomycetota bacterium]